MRRAYVENEDKMVKKERSGKALSFSVRKVDEYTEKYEPITKAVVSAEEILRDRKPCTPERIGYIRTGQLALNDMTASRVKETLGKEFIDAIRSCNEGKKKECETFLDSSS